MKGFTSLSAHAHEALFNLGRSAPTVHPAAREVKGWQPDEFGGGKVYYSADDLRKYAAGLIEVADWLDARAASTTRESQ